MRHLVLVSVLAILWLAVASTANAQTGALSPKIRITVKDSQHGDARYTGRWGVVTVDSLTLVEELPSTTSRTFGRADIEEVEQERRTHTSEGRGALIGVASGGAVGAIVAASVASSCSPPPGDFFGGCFLPGTYAFGGFLLGGLVGGLAGAILGSKAHHATWEPVGMPKPETHSMVIHPIIAPSIHGLAVGVDLGF